MKKSNYKKEAWIKNVIRIFGYSREKTEYLYNKINPYKDV